MRDGRPDLARRVLLLPPEGFVMQDWLIIAAWLEGRKAALGE